MNKVYKKEKNRQQGFTLFEILVVIGLMGLVGSMTLGLFAYILKGAAKASFLKKANDNGVYIIDVIAKEIRNASEIGLCGASQVLITKSGGSTVEFNCVTDDGRSVITENGGEMIEENFSLVDCNVFDCSESPQMVGINFELTAWDSEAGDFVEKGEGGFRTEFRHKAFPRNY